MKTYYRLFKINGKNTACRKHSKPRNYPENSKEKPHQKRKGCFIKGNLFFTAKSWKKRSKKGILEATKKAATFLTM